MPPKRARAFEPTTQNLLRFQMATVNFKIGDLELCATKTTTTALALTTTGEAFLARVAKQEMPPYTPLNVTVFRALVNHAGVLTEDVFQEILAFFEREKATQQKYAVTLDALWALLGWRSDMAQLETLLGGADLTTLHQFLGIMIQQPSLSRNATYLDRALYALYHHPMFEQLFDAESVKAVQENIQFRLLERASQPEENNS